MDLPDVSGKKALLIIAPENFRDEEYFETKKILEQQGAEVVTASGTLGEARGMLGGKAPVDVLIGSYGQDYDAVVFIGGSGAQTYFNETDVHEIAIQASEKGKIIAAICIAPVILANAGILRGKRATCWGNEFSSMLEEAGAEYTGEDVVRDRNIITANGPGAAKDFGREIVKALAEV